MNAHVAGIEARRSGEWSIALPGKLSAAVKEFDFSKSTASKSIGDLGLKFEIDGMLVDADSATIGKRDWTAPGTVFLVLKYEDKDGSKDYLTESFPILVKFSVKNEKIEIRDIEADVSSFDR